MEEQKNNNFIDLTEKTKTQQNFFSKYKNFVNHSFDFVPDWLRTRVITSICLIPVALFFIYSSKEIFFIFVLLIAILEAFEWITISNTKNDDLKWKLLGLIYILLPTVSLVYLKNKPNGSNIILWMFLIIWTTDIFAMLVGKTIGGPKLAPKTSPKKTWSGLIGGIFACMILGFLTSVLFNGSIKFFIFFSGFLAILEQISDLLESKFKRYFEVKDSGNIIPGHGGVMDRLDGLTLVAPFIAFVVAFIPSVF